MKGQENGRKRWKEMSGWEKVKIIGSAVGSVVSIAGGAILLLLGFRSKPTRRSVWPKGGGGKKPGSRSSGRHR